ncbi:MAG TPA: trypsin-like serine protease [Polyangia bacterium]
MRQIARLAALAFSTACTEPPATNNQFVEESASIGPVDPLLHVVGGKPSAVCGFPMTAKIPGCTSTLLTPTILITARHCKPTAGMTVQFGEKTPYGFSVRAVKCVSAPDSDAAYCVLPDDERLKRVPTVPPLHGCEYTKFMKAGAQITGVGWGDTKGTAPSRTKNQAVVPVVRVGNPLIATGDPDTDLCFGDSGGGGYIHLVEAGRDWGWRVFGTVTGTTRIPGGAACGGTSYTSVQRHVRMIEENENIDVTPCTDAQGRWAPGPACTAFLVDPSAGGGGWPVCPSGPLTSLPQDSCGMNATAVSDAGMVPSDARADVSPIADAPPAPRPDAESAPRMDAADTAPAPGFDANGGIDAATPGAAKPDGRTEVGASEPSKGGEAQRPEPPVGGSPPVVGSGCACELAGTANDATSPAPVLGFLALALVLRRRRRDRR